MYFANFFDIMPLHLGLNLLKFIYCVIIDLYIASPPPPPTLSLIPYECIDLRFNCLSEERMASDSCIRLNTAFLQQGKKYLDDATKKEEITSPWLQLQPSLLPTLPFIFFYLLVPIIVVDYLF